MLKIDVHLSRGQFRLAAKCAVPLAGITAIIGASGSGKTTLLRAIAGLEAQAHGHVSIGEEIWLSERTFVPAHRRAVGFVFQNGALFDHLSVGGNLNLAERFRRKRARSTNRHDVISALSLEPLLDRPAPTLSGGERQRVAIARALLANPRLLLMDEPLSALDPAARRELLSMIATVSSEFSLPTLYVTHNHDELVRVGSQAILMESGKIADLGTIPDIVRQASWTGRPPPYWKPESRLTADPSRRWS